MRAKIHLLGIEEDKAFEKEKCALLTILLIFAFGYITRAIFDFMQKFNQPKGSQSFTVYMIWNFVQIPFTIVPIMSILIMHRRNLRTTGIMNDVTSDDKTSTNHSNSN